LGQQTQAGAVAVVYRMGAASLELELKGGMKEEGYVLDGWKCSLQVQESAYHLWHHPLGR
jgi:hypothetical protein